MNFSKSVSDGRTDRETDFLNNSSSLSGIFTDGQTDQGYKVIRLLFQGFKNLEKRRTDRVMEGRRDGRTDGRTDRGMEGQTDSSNLLEVTICMPYFRTI